MTQQFSLKLLSLAVATTLTLTACGDDDSSKNTTTPIQPTNNNTQPATPTTQTAIGKFLDSAVEGVEVFQNGKSLGKTNAKGEYTYVVGGGAVTFKLGSLTLGSTMPKAIVTPADLTTDSQQLVRTLQILQSADKDNNPANGISIDNTVAERFTASDFNDLLKEENDDKFKTILQPKLNNGQIIVASDKALNHFKETSTTQLAQSPDLVSKVKSLEGYWAEACDDMRDIVKIEANGNTLHFVQGQVHEYSRTPCSGTRTITPYTPKIVGNHLTFTGVGQLNTLPIAQALEYRKNTFQQLTSVYFGDNFIEFDHVYLHRIKSFDDLTLVTNHNPTEVKKAVNRLPGYWQSHCYNSYKHKKRFKLTHNSEQTLYYITKSSDESFNLVKSIDVYYTDKNCQTVDMVVANTHSQLQTLSDPQIINGKPSFTIGGQYRLTFIDDNQFVLSYNNLSKTTQAIFDSWFSRADTFK